MRQPITIPLTRRQFEQKRKQAAAGGWFLHGDTGIAEMSGVKIEYSYDGKMLTVNMLDKPFLLPASMVEGKIREWLTS